MWEPGATENERFSTSHSCWTWHQTRSSREHLKFRTLIPEFSTIPLSLPQRKSWKKRFFVLTEVSLGYYKTLEEVEPIRTISVGDMSSCSMNKE